METVFSIDRRLDCSGHLCPVPILMTEEKMGQMRKGEVLEVLFTDPAAHEDLKAWCRMASHEFLSFKKQGNKSLAVIRKAGP